ncbi:hypothetical protein [Rhizobium leguminosarum]
MACLEGCPVDHEQFDPASPGPVEDEETVCRGAFGKRAHYTNSGVLRHAFIRGNDLIAGSLSIWRIDENSPEEKEEIKALIEAHPPPENRLWDIMGAAAGSIRSIRAPSRPDEQALHVFDDCVIDDSGNKHPKHAAIGICKTLHSETLEKDTPLYVEIRDALHQCFMKRAIWSLPQSERR